MRSTHFALFVFFNTSLNLIIGIKPSRVFKSHSFSGSGKNQLVYYYYFLCITFISLFFFSLQFISIPKPTNCFVWNGCCAATQSLMSKFEYNLRTLKIISKNGRKRDTETAIERKTGRESELKSSRTVNWTTTKNYCF